MDPKTQIHSVVIYAGTIFDAQLVQSLLESSEIHAYLKDEYSGTLVPWWVSPGGAAPVKVLVADKDEAEARSIVADWEKTNQTGQ